MVDAFPLPRHREKSCCSRSQCSHKKPRFYPRARGYSITKNCVELMRAVLADIQRGAEQLQMSMSMNNYDGSRRFTSSHSRSVLIYHHGPQMAAGLRMLGRKPPKWGRRRSKGGLFETFPKDTCPGVLHRSTGPISMTTNGIHVFSTRTRKFTVNVGCP